MNHTISPLSPTQQELWDYLLSTMYTGMVRDALAFMHRRPDVIITQVIAQENSLWVMCRRIRSKIGFEPNPTWVRAQCAAIAAGRGLTSEP